MNNKEQEPKEYLIDGIKYKSDSFSSIDAFILQLKRNNCDHNSLEEKDLDNFTMIIEELRVYLIEKTAIKDWTILKDHLSKWFPEYIKKDNEEDKNAKRVIIWELEKDNE